MGAATSLRMTRTTFFLGFWGFIFILDFHLRAQYSSTYGRPITYLVMGGSLVEFHSLVELFLFIPRPHSF
jgi:hypothetical protein